jgi:hypothetical protein
MLRCEPPAWTPRHTLAAAAATLLTYTWHAFPETPAVPALPVVDLIGNVIFALGAVLLIGMAWRRTAIASTIVIDSAHPLTIGHHLGKGAKS